VTLSSTNPAAVTTAGGRRSRPRCWPSMSAPTASAPCCGCRCGCRKA
jgi:hypothetical protein